MRLLSVSTVDQKDTLPDSSTVSMSTLVHANQPSTEITPQYDDDA